MTDKPKKKKCYNKYIPSPYKEKGTSAFAIVGTNTTTNKLKEVLDSAGTVDKPGKVFGFDQSQGGKG